MKKQKIKKLHAKINKEILQHKHSCTFFLLLISVFFQFASVQAQQVVPSPSANDTVRIVHIIQGNSLREKVVDTATTLETIAGNVILKEDGTTFYCDSATINQKTNMVEAFGNIHINDNDSIHTYSQYLKYNSQTKIANMKKDVKMTDKKTVLTTNDFEYNLSSGIGKYFSGGKVVNGKTTLTSTNGVYYADTKDVYFKNNVHLIDPKYDIRDDSLMYNTQSQVATFISETFIKSKNGGDIYTKQGTYDLKNGKAFFGKRSIIKDSTRTYISDNSAYDEKEGIAQLEGNAIIRDSVNGYTILGNQIFLNKNNNSFLATRKPVLIFRGDGNDSTYIAADTLFSGVEKREITKNKDTLVIDTLKKTTVIHNSTDTTVRYFMAFHQVRIFNDSMQAVCDSLLYEDKDSTFKLFKNPVLFSHESQISGDTMYLFTKNKKPTRLYVFDKGIIINKTHEDMYNQIGGRTLNGYFVKGTIDYMRVKGQPAESIFYPQDNDSAYTGMNRAKADVIDIFFRNKELYKVKFSNDVDGTMYPMRKIPEDVKHLKNFIWLEKRRPKNKLELFE